MALTRRYRTDAHFAQYAAPNRRRLSRDALGRVKVELGVIVFDIDCGAVHGSHLAAPDSWRECQRRRVHELSRVHGSPFYYETRGGARIVYLLREPATIASEADATNWSRNYAVAAAYLQRRFDIEVDRACGDWQRLFRLPRSTRTGNRPETWATRGDPRRIAALEIEPTPTDLADARRTCKAFVDRQIADFSHSESDGFGLLYHALRARGALVRRHHRPNAFVIVCPRERLHTSGRTGDGSTLLYLPAVGHHVGAIHCLHGHCASMTVRDWLREFERPELDSASIASGRRSAG